MGKRAVMGESPFFCFAQKTIPDELPSQRKRLHFFATMKEDFCFFAKEFGRLSEVPRVLGLF
jgi:hypothetical protein